MQRRSSSPRPEPTAAERRGRMLLIGFALTLLLAAALLGGIAGSASGQGQERQLELVRDRQDRLAGEIEARNGEVNALIAEVSRMRSREQEVAAELASTESELREAAAELRAGRERLAELREELGRATGELERMLLRIYKEGSPDLGSLLLDSSDFDDFALQSEYFNRVQDYQSAVIERARDLRAEAEALVAGLAADRDRIAAAREAIADRRDELAASRADLEAQESELRSARQARRRTLEGLERREDRLVEPLSRPEPAAQPTNPEQPATESDPDPAPAPGATAELGPDGKAIPPAGAPPAVVSAINAANEISDAPYKWGGGHGTFEDSGYDCSGAVSYALHGAGVLSSPLDSTGFMFWGDSGPGQWVTVYANSGHAYVVIAGLRFDTSGGAGPRWHPDARSSAGFVARHPSGL